MSAAASSLPCPGCRALTAELDRERRELWIEVRKLEDRLGGLRRAAAQRCGIFIRSDMSDEDLIVRLTGGDS